MFFSILLWWNTFRCVTNWESTKLQRPRFVWLDDVTAECKVKPTRNENILFVLPSKRKITHTPRAAIRSSWSAHLPLSLGVCACMCVCVWAYVFACYPRVFAYKWKLVKINTNRKVRSSEQGKCSTSVVQAIIEKNVQASGCGVDGWIGQQ